MKKYLIGLVIISVLAFFLISNNSNSNESNSFTNAVSPTPLQIAGFALGEDCLLYTSPSPRDLSTSRMPSSA